MGVDWTITITIATFVILLAGLFGGYISLKNNISKSNSEIQNHVRDALKDENELLQSRVLRLETENRRLNDMINLLITIFDKRGITILIDDGLIQVKEKDGSVVTVRQQGQTTVPPTV